MKIVLIARHFPPAISGGARRPFVLRSALKRLGHEVFVVAPRLPNGVDGVSVAHPAEAGDPDGIVRDTPRSDPIWRVWQRELLLWPDPDRWWANKVIDEAGKKIRALAPDLIISTSPPESIHHAGAILSQQTGSRWIADFRDSWLKESLNPQRERLYRRLGETYLARRWLRQADLVTAPTAFILQEMRELGAPRATHLYPQLSVPAPRGPRASLPMWDAAPEGTIRILHTGSFSMSDPKRLLSPVLERFAKESPNSAHLYIAGRLSASEHALVEKHKRASWLGLVQPDTVRHLQSEADAVLLAASPGTAAVPGKLSEYASAGTPIIAIGDGPWMTEAHIPSRITLRDAELLAENKSSRKKCERSQTNEDESEALIAADRETLALLTAFQLTLQ